jgi:methyl-accepting chemotaxis protein
VKLKLKIMHKIMAMTAIVLLLSVAAIVLIANWQSSQSMSDLAKSDLEHLTRMGYELCTLNAKVAQQTVRQNMQVAHKLFEELSGRQVAVANGQMQLGAGRSKYVVNGNYDFVDEIKRLTGATCTIFLNDGSQATRIATNVLKEDGTRAIGTTLSPTVYNEVVRGNKAYFGRAWVVTDWYETAYEPIRDDKQNIVGVLYVGVKERSEGLRNALLSQKVGKTGYIYTMDSKGILQLHPAKEGADLSKYAFIQEMMEKGPKLANGEIGWVVYPWQNKELGDKEPRDKIVAYAYLKDWDWVIAAGSYLDEFTAPVTALRNTMLLAGIISLLLALALSFAIARSITRPIGILVGATEQINKDFSSFGHVVEAIADNDLTQRIPETAVTQIDVKSQDEVGTLARTIEGLIGTKVGLSRSVGKMTDSLTIVVRQLTDNTRNLVSAATEIAASSEQMAKGSREQSDQVNQVSTAVEEMTANIMESSRNAGEATTTAKGASDTASAGGQVVNNTITGMQKIADVVRQSAESIAKLAKSADRIGEIIAVIDDIADQTNLLALNAAIEAARAGEQGRGFAVVADEVRKLAERTGKATGEITGMIKGIQRETEDAVGSMESGIQQVDKGRELADKAGTSLNEIVVMVQRVTDMIQQIATAANEQSSAAEQISKNIEHISSVTRETATGAEQSAAAAEELNRQADGLQQMVARFKIDGGNLGIIDIAKDDHRRYVANLELVISGKAPVSDWKRTDHHNCRFGKWYFGDGGANYGSLPEFRAVDGSHSRVHEHANDAVRALENRDLATAKRLFEESKRASAEVIANLDRLLQAARTVRVN